MRAPAFWAEDGLLARLLAPLSGLYAAATARRLARPGWHAPVPVICCGNATVGGAGKTTLALDLAARLAARGARPAFLTRGYGGRVGGVLRVDQAVHPALLVGDEALLLAAAAPTYVGADRAAAARLAVAGGASVLVMDDGLQNASLVKDVSLLVIDGAVGFGNGRVLPAGPLREPVAVAAARCRAAVLIGGTRGEAALPAGFPVLHAHLEAAPEGRALAGQRVLAFAGIGRPEKFFATLAATGAILTALRPFPDHHPYSDAEQQALLREAASLGALPVTTPKDWVRLAPAVRPAIRPIGVSLVWHEPDAIAALLAELAP